MVALHEYYKGTGKFLNFYNAPDITRSTTIHDNDIMIYYNDMPQNSILSNNPTDPK